MPQLKQATVELHFELAGNGPPLLFIQGVGASGEAWRPQVNVLAHEFQTLIFDNRGIGRSIPCPGPHTIEAMADDARALMDHAGWSSGHLVGHSMGGVIAQQLALDAPERIRSLSLICTFPRGKDGARLTPWVLWMTLRTRLGSRSMRRKAFLEMLYPKSVLAGTQLEGLAQHVAQLVGRDLADSPPVLMKQVRALARHDISPRLPELNRIPTLVISAEHDPIARPAYGRRLAALIPGARHKVIPGASHGVTLHKPDAINATLREHVTSAQERFVVQTPQA